MTNYEFWLRAQSKEFQAGYDAAADNYPRWPWASAEWLRGWDKFAEYMTRSENSRAA